MSYLLKTPSAVETEGGIMEIRPGANAHYKLRDQIAMLPTPTDSMVTMQDMVQAKFHSSKRPKYSEANLLPTPSSGGQSRDTAPHGKHSPSTGAIVGKNRGLKLQPAFVEWMMGYPDKWTELID